MKYFKVLEILGMIFLFSAFSIMAQTYTSTVKGRVIDDYGNPVANAVVDLETITDGDIDLVSYARNSTYTDKDGKFVVENTSTQANRKRKLFISGPLFENAISLIDLPPNDNLRRLKPDLQVDTISLKENDSVDVGDTRIRVWSGVVEISLLGENDQPYFQTERDWRRSYYVLRGESGEPVVARGISGYDTELRINVKKGLIRFAVPEGTWTIELLSELKLDNSDYVIAKTEKFCVKRNADPLKLKLIALEKR